MTVDEHIRRECYGCEHVRSIPGDAHIACVNPDPHLRFHEQGIRNGWANYPINFDPIWKLDLCANHTPGDGPMPPLALTQLAEALRVYRHRQQKGAT